jgi:3-hydroxyisobutyrate dehydrogenase-like beta-hydroxyacid dehydrogenase
MGSSIGAALVEAGLDVRWASDNRSHATRTRAVDDGLTDVGSLPALVEGCEVIVSVCPPGEALTVARAIAELGFAGTYLDANAVAPDTARSIAEAMNTAGARCLDGGIIGPPARHPGLTVLYLSGDRMSCDAVAALFSGSPVETHDVGREIGAASAVKMTFAAWTKGTSALLLAIRAVAEAEGVVDGLDHAWAKLTPELASRFPATARGTAPKAWRFVDEMHEIASTFESAGLPPGFHEAAAAVYGSLADLRDQREVDVDDVMRRLTGG